MLSLVTIAIAHALGNLATIISLQSGSVSFTHVIKSSEPLFTALLSIVLLNSYYNMEVYLSLMPIVFGVGIASFQEVTFTWIGFISGLLSNLFYQLRIVLSKKLLTNKTNSSSSSNSKAVVPYGQHSEYDNSTENNNSTRSNSNKLSPSNLFRVLTLLSFFILLFPAITLEKNLLKDSYLIYMRMETINRRMLLSNLLLSGFSYYIYNEITFWIIELVHPITQAVGNTIKRIVIIIAAVLLLNAPINGMGILGASIAIAGSFLYALAFQRFNSSK